MADFKILALQNPEFQLLAGFQILALQNFQFKVLADLKILAYTILMAAEVKCTVCLLVPRTE